MAEKLKTKPKITANKKNIMIKLLEKNKPEKIFDFDHYSITNFNGALIDYDLFRKGSKYNLKLFKIFVNLWNISLRVRNVIFLIVRIKIQCNNSLL